MDQRLNIHCSSSRSRFNTQHPHAGSQPPITPVPRDLTPSSDLTYMHTHTHTHGGWLLATNIPDLTLKAFFLTDLETARERCLATCSNGWCYYFSTARAGEVLHTLPCY